MESLGKKLLTASAAGKADEVKSLLEQGAEIDVKADFDRTSLHLAAMYGRTETVMLLIAAGADVRHKDSLGSTALHFALYSARFSMLTEASDVTIALINAGVDIHATNTHGRTALQLAGKNIARKAAIALIAHGADASSATDMLNFPDLTGLTMRQAAVQGGLVDRLQVLLDQHPEEGDGDTPEELVKLAMQHTQDDAAAVLQAYMAARAIEEVLQPAPGMRAAKR